MKGCLLIILPKGVLLRGKIHLDFNHGCIKSECTTGNYSFDWLIKFYLKKHIFEQSSWFAFCHVFRMPVTYKIGQNDFDGIFLQDSPEQLSYFRCKLFCNKDIFQNIFLLMTFGSYLSIWAFFPKTLSLNNSKRRRVSS